MEDEFYYKINDWLEGNMSDRDKTAFEAEMEKNPALAKEAHLAKGAMAAIQEKEVIDFREQMGKIMSEKIPAPKNNNKWKIIWAIGMLLTLALIAFLLLNKKETKNTETPVKPVALYDKYFPVPEKLISIENVRTEMDLDSLKKNIDKLIGELNGQFQGKDYQKAFITLSSLIDADPENNIVQERDLNIAKGLLYLETNQPQLAVDALEKANKNMTWDDAQWYLAAAYIKLKKFSEAELVLKKLLESSDPNFQKQAKSLLNDLDNLE